MNDKTRLNMRLLLSGNLGRTGRSAVLVPDLLFAAADSVVVVRKWSLGHDFV